MRDTLIAGLTSFTDKSFLDPASTAIVEHAPGQRDERDGRDSVDGQLPGRRANAARSIVTGAPNAIDPVLITNAGHAAAIRSMNAGGGVGLPIVVSDAALGNTIAMDPAFVFVADNGVEIDISREATIELVDSPAAPTAASVMTSLFQLNLVGFRVERFLNWTATPGAVKYLAG